ncbi:MAG TPA: lysylphosphatidylglycerol synthase domain-containing protein [Candidatus Saccharimonadales bacterium]|nr:lysylphosphatidylglycerol synthase domain-containing protein [Candidatus Saccharimonadales bacterium]
MRRRLKTFAVIIVLPLTAVVFVRFFIQHPEVGKQLHNTSPGLLVLLLALYLLSIAALTFNTYATLLLCNLKVKTRENFLLTAYSAVINFFGPLQSGPAFRAVYLKKKYSLNLKNYATATLMYLAFWGIFSVMLLLSGLLKWWLLAVLALIALGLAFASRLPQVSQRLAKLSVRHWYYLALSTALQIGCVVFIYYSELHSVAPHTSFSQAVVYTGAANLALYVSLTPGAIGFRESFLVFSRHLHHISNNTIVAANILDRAVYIILLLLLAAFIFASHAQQRLTAVTKQAKD